MTIHLVQFRQCLSAEQHSFEGPAGAGSWRFGPDSPIGANGLRTRLSDVWGGFAFFDDEAAARAVVDDPSRSLAFQGETLQSWHALLCPINHRGKTNWFANDDGSAPIAPSETDPGGPLLVLTTAGFDPLPPDELKADLPRRVDFIRNVEEVRNCFAAAPGNLARGVFQMATMAEDGCTFSLWASDALMMESAYRPGIHRTQIDRYRAEKTADRSSFTRTRLLRAHGTWNGSWKSADIQQLGEIA